jgi:hypothetical protein
MKDLSQGVTASSFDRQIPKLLYDCTGYMVVKTDESYFNQVKTYKDWEEPQTCSRDHIKVDLESYEQAHTNMVTGNTTPSSPLQTAASLSGAYALAWFAAFIAFIDKTYAELTKAKFSSARGWSLITNFWLPAY